MILAVVGVITASEPPWIAPFTGLSPRASGKLVARPRREGADASGGGRPWKLSLEDRVLPVAVYGRTDRRCGNWPCLSGCRSLRPSAPSTTSA
jgi:hypothetical protein